MARTYMLSNITALAFIGASVLYLFPFYPDLQPEAFSFGASRKFAGPLAANQDLDSVQVIGSKALIGPECYEFFKGYIYTGTRDGKIHRIKQDKIETIIDWKCNYQENRPNYCSRPLGMRINNRTKELYVADSVKGLYKYDLRTGIIQILFNASQPINGNFSRLTDDLTIMKTGDIYFTDASVKWNFDELLLDILESAGNGRILHFDPKTNTTKVVLENLYFPNGIQLSPGEDFFIFAESSRQRILKYNLKGPEKGKVEVFIDNLPGFPDNIRASGRGTYWVAFAKARMETPGPFELLSNYPSTRRFITRMAHLFLIPLAVSDYFNITDNAHAEYKFMPLQVMSLLTPKYGLVIELDAKGEIIRSLHSPKGLVRDISTATEHEGYLYIGSPWAGGMKMVKIP